MKTALLLLIVVFAKAAEMVTGFGGSVIALSLGSTLMPIKELVVAVVIVSLLLSLWMVFRNYQNIQWRILLLRILPLTALGLPIGRWIFSHYGAGQLKLIMGAFITFIATLELINLYRTHGRTRTLPWPLSMAFLLAGGVVHGIFGTGGPLIVYYACRQIPDKAPFRATIPVLWVILNAALIASYAATKSITPADLRLAGLLLPALVVGIIIGEILHPRVNEFAFRVAVQVVLLITGIAFLVHG